MGTVIRPQLSEKNKYWVEKHRYYELKHFCLQYPIWKKAYLALDSLSVKPMDVMGYIQNSQLSNPVEKCVEAREFYFDRMKLIEHTAMTTDDTLCDYLLKGITEGMSYDVLKARLDIPCCRDVYYELYRRFFWLLNKARG